MVVRWIPVARRHGSETVREPTPPVRRAIGSSLLVGAVDDPAEREADAVADVVVRDLSIGGRRWPQADTRVARRVDGPAAAVESHGGAAPGGVAASRIRRAVTVSSVHDVAGAEYRPARVRRDATAGLDPGAGPVDAATERQIQSSRGGGTPLEPADRSSMESAFGADLGSVRIHEGAGAAALNDRVQARAFTIGNDIFFRDGAPDTSTSDGRHLLAHELTHTIQQSGVRRVQRVRACAITGRVGAPRIQRNAITKLADLEGKLPSAKAVRDRAFVAGLSVAALDEIKAEIDRIVTESSAIANEGLTDKTNAGYHGRINSTLKRITTFRDEVYNDKVLGTASLTTMTAAVTAFEGTLVTRTNAALGQFQSVVASLQDSIDASTAKRLASAAKSAGHAQAELEATLATFGNESKAILDKVSDWSAAAQKSDVAAEPARRVLVELGSSVDITTRALERLRHDGSAARQHIVGRREAIKRAADAAAEAKQRDEELSIRTVELSAAEGLVAKATSDADRCAEEADVAADLAAKARIAAGDAEQAATQAGLQAQRTAGDAHVAQAALATVSPQALETYTKHLNQWPTPEATKAAPHTKAATAAFAAQEAGLGHEQAVSKARDLAGRVGPLEEEAAATRAGQMRSSEKLRGAQAGRDLAVTEHERAAAAASSATATAADRAQEAKSAKPAGEAFLRALGMLDPRVSTEADWLKLRVQFGDDGTVALLDKGIRATVLLKHSIAIREVQREWGVQDAGDVIRKAQDLADGVDVPWSSFLASATALGTLSAADAQTLLDCCGATFDWFRLQGIRAARRLLELGWTPAQVRRAFVAAETTTDLSADGLSKLVALVERAGLGPDFAEKLLQIGLPAPTFVAVLPGVEGLIGLPGWPADDIVGLLATVSTGVPLRLDSSQFGVLVNVIKHTSVSVADANKLLTCGLNASSLVAALPNIEVLLGAPSAWTVDEVVPLLTAVSAAPLSLTTAQLGQLCRLLRTRAVMPAHGLDIVSGADCSASYLLDTAFVVLHEAITDGWTTVQLQSFVKSAEKTVKFTKMQLTRFWRLVHDNTFAPANVDLCLASPNIGNWDSLITLAENFEADGNTGSAAAPTVTGQNFRVGGHQLKVPAERIVHFCVGHTYRYFRFTDRNINRGENSTLWAKGTNAADVSAKAFTAAGKPAMAGQVTDARNGLGGARNRHFVRAVRDESDIGVEWFPNAQPPHATLMQLYSVGTPVLPAELRAIGLLFNGAIPDR